MSTEQPLKLVGPIHIVGGLLLALSGFLPPVQAILEPFFTASGQLAWSPFFVSVFGPTIASWGLLFGVLVDQFYTMPTLRLWHGLAASLLVWAPLDTALCVYHGFYAGAVINAFVFIVVGALLLAAKKRIL